VLCIQGKDKHNCGGNRALIFKIAGFACLGILGIYLMIFAKLFNKINLGIGILQAVSKCAMVMNQIRFVPWVLIFITTGIAAFFIMSITESFSIGTLGTIPALSKTFFVSNRIDIDGGYVKIYTYDSLMRVLGGFSLFCFQWWLGSILLFSDSVTAYSLSIWFFEKRKETVVVIKPYFVLINSFL
jgi:hypothetical protein